MIYQNLKTSSKPKNNRKTKRKKQIQKKLFPKTSELGIKKKTWLKSMEVC